MDGIPVTDHAQVAGHHPACVRCRRFETIPWRCPRPEGPWRQRAWARPSRPTPPPSPQRSMHSTASDAARCMRDSAAARALLPRLARETAGVDDVPASAVTPVLVCAHHHLTRIGPGDARPARSRRARGDPGAVWWRLTRPRTREIRWSAMLGALEALESGTTAIIDHHESPNAIEGSLDVIAAACAEVGVRSVLAYGITDRHGPDGARRGLAENERFLRAGGRGLVGIHAAFTSPMHPARGGRPRGGPRRRRHVHVCEAPRPRRAARWPA